MAYHDHGVFAQERIDHGLSEQHAVSHILDSCALLVANILESDRVADLVQYIRLSVAVCAAKHPLL